MRKKTLLVLAAGPLQLPAITVGKRLGLRVVAADGDPNAPGLALADVAHVIDIGDPEVCLRVARAEKVDGVIHICSEVAMASLALVNSEMGLHGICLGTVVSATNKEQMRRAFERGGAPSPRSIGVTTDDAALAAAVGIAGAVIVKPSRNSGSRGVTHLPAGVEPERVIAAFRRAMAESRDHSALVEEYVEGPEFSVEALVWDRHIEVLAITDKLTTGQPFFVEVGHNQPTQLSPHDAGSVRQAAIAGIRALALDGCAAHAEIKLSPTGPFIIEIGARLGGDFITTELVPRSTGIDMVAGAIRLALGEEPDLAPTHAPRGVAIRYFQPHPGTVQVVECVDEAMALPGVAVIDIRVQVGDVVPQITSSLSRVGHVIAEGQDAVEAIAAAERARDTVRITTAAPTEEAANGC